MSLSAAPLLTEPPVQPTAVDPVGAPNVGHGSAAPAVHVPLVPTGRLWNAADLRNPYGIFADLAQAGPLHWSPHLFGGTWVVARHADAEHVLRNEALFSAQRTGGWVWADTAPALGISPNPALPVPDVASPGGDSASTLMLFQQMLARALLFVDAPDHARLRSLMHAGFTPSGLAAQRPWIQARCNQLLNAMQDQQQHTPQRPVDFMEQLARPLPAAVIAHTLGLPSGDEQEVMAWSSDIAGFIGSPWPNRSTTRAAQRGLLRMSHYLQAMLAAPSRLAPHGLLGRLLAGQAEGKVHNALELLAQAAMLLFAGHETTRYLLGNMVHTLLTQRMPALDGASHTMTAWQYLAQLPPDAQAQQIPHVVREVLRFEPPVQYTGRRIARTHTWHGQTLQRGQGMLVLLAAAGRDGQRFAEPNRFDVYRRGRASLAFGTGAHVCIGAALSMMEAEITLAAMLTHWPRLALAPVSQTSAGVAVAAGKAALLDASAQTAADSFAGAHHADWLGSALYRGLQSLPLCLDATLVDTSLSGDKP